MKRFKLIAPVFILVGGFIMSTVSYAKPEYTKKEKKGCVTCHVKASSKDLNKVGECYKDKKSLEGCAEKK